jgi:hypothetical protein
LYLPWIIVDKATRVAAVGKGILALLSVVMSRTHAATRLWTVCDALFEHAIFGMEATELMVLNEMYQKSSSGIVKSLLFGKF